MPKTIQGQLIAGDQQFAVVVSRFNEFVCSRLLAGALDTLERHGVPEGNVTVVWVPGSFEMPVAVKRLAAGGRYAAVICLGAVIRGSTPHFNYIAAEVSKGIAQTALETGVPCLFGVLTTDTIEQAIERAGAKAGNKGSDAAAAAIEMVNLFAQLDR